METGRPLCVRIEELSYGKRRVEQNTPLNAHRTQRNNGKGSDVKVNILVEEPETSERKANEAF